jgi:hypothetical protein
MTSFAKVCVIFRYDQPQKVGSPSNLIGVATNTGMAEAVTKKLNDQDPLHFYDFKTLEMFDVFKDFITAADKLLDLDLAKQFS